MLQVPTDKLYKFIAIFGLAIAITSIGVAYKELEKYRESHAKLNNLKTELGFLEMQAKNSLDRYNSLEKKLFDKVSFGLPLTQLEKEQLKELVKTLEDGTAKYCETVGSVAPKIVELKTLQKYSPHYFFVAGILFVCGIAISAYGFHIWHKNSIVK